MNTRRAVVRSAVAALIGAVAWFPVHVLAQRRAGRSTNATAPSLTQLLGHPTDRSITLSVLSPADVEVYVEYGVRPGQYGARTDVATARAGVPLEIEIGELLPDTRYHYRLRDRPAGGARYREGWECAFHTQRAPGRAFTFALQGDSHPERLHKMYEPDLYRLTLSNVHSDQPDFYLALGDDFSIDPLANNGQLTQQNVDQLYVDQRQFLGDVASSASLFLVNGNHEQAARYLLDGRPDSPSLLSGRARTRFFPLPAPDAFYSGDAEQVDGIGLLRDYYAWTWGDALFVVIDPYWHSPAQVDAGLGGGGGERRIPGTHGGGAQRRPPGESKGWGGGGRLATGGASPSAMRSTGGSRRRSSKAGPATSSCSPTTSWARAAVASRWPTSTSGAARTRVAPPSSRPGGRDGSCRSTS